MANFVYNRALQAIASGDLDLNAAGTVVRCMLERSTSTYTPDKDHDYVSDLTGFVEISVASYARVTLATKAVNLDDTNDRAEFDADDLSFGSLETGQTVDALVLYQQTGGSDASPSDDLLIAYIDTATGLPAVLNGGAFTITIDAEGLIQFASA